MPKSKYIWIEYLVFPGTNCPVKAKYRMENGEVVSVRLVTKVPRGYYYSFIQDAISTLEKTHPELKFAE